jgi:cell division ATPase FtsA
MSKKRVYAALEIADHEVRLLVFEVFDGRQNVLRMERIAHEGCKDQKIVNEGSIVKAINEALSNAQAALGYRIDRVLLALPSQDVSTARSRVKVSIEDGARKIRLFHLQQGYQSAIEKAHDEQVELVNVSRIEYEYGDKKTTKLPVGEECEEFKMDTELLYANKELIYSYVRAIEQANITVQDVFLDTYAAGLESGAQILSEEAPVIQVILESGHTTFTLFYKGHISAVMTKYEGYDDFARDLEEEYDLAEPVLYRLLQNLFSANEEDFGEDIIYADQIGDERLEISGKELYEKAMPAIHNWIDMVSKTCEPLLSAGNVRYLITGQGASLPVIKQLTDEFNAPAIVYQPTSIGARDNALVSVLGLGYAWRNQNKIKKNDEIAASINDIEASLDSIKSTSSNEEDGSFTKKMRSLILAD